jgi:tight junction protein 1
MHFYASLAMVVNVVSIQVCRDSQMAPPLDPSKGETLLSPLVMCGPQGLRFEKSVELRLPHSASGVNSEQWSFALKSASGAEAEWKQVGASPQYT